MTTSTEDILLTLERERSARRQAEQVLEKVNRELVQTNLELKASKNSLEKEIRRSQAVFDTAAEGIIIFDDQGTIESINRAARSIFVLEEESPNDRNICEFFPEAAFCQRTEPACFITNLRKLVGATNELTGRKEDGSSIPLEFIVSSFSHAGSNTHSAIVRDLTRRKLLESQLAHAQKLESVGQLAAGIAHELNTPIQFVGDNTRFLRDSFLAIEEILVHVDNLIQQSESCESLRGFAESVSEVYQRCDLPFMREEVPMAIEQTLEGAENVARIVRAMKVFSHPGTKEYQEIDLNQSLESTLTVSRNEWKYCAVVETNFCENLPHVHCFPGELNQAFLNLIVNGAHAIQTKSREIGKIVVTTRFDQDSVYIDIEDSGTGIPESIHSRIFDPFFTTKGVGKGTGQGLSICYNIIVEMHHGSLTFQTEEGRGTTFHISLPIDPRKSAANIEGES